MPFFIRNKQKAATKTTNSKPSAKKRKAADEEIVSDEEAGGEEVERRGGHDSSSSEEEGEETVQEKRLRLAKMYLAQLAEEEADQAEGEELKRDPIAHRLHQEVLEARGRVHHAVAAGAGVMGAVRVLRGHRLSVTCVAISPDERYVFSASKDASIIKWDVASGKKVHTVAGGRKGTEDSHVGHTGPVLCMALSSDGQFLATGCVNKLIHVWDATSCALVHTFRGHRDAVTGLVFRAGTHQLFSASHDRSVKIWSVDERAYVETLFGHESGVTGIAAGARDRAITSGGRDGSVRVWKIAEESQLVFHGHKGVIDCVALLNDAHFVSGADDNSLAVWGVHKKRPLGLVQRAHCGTAPGHAATPTDSAPIPQDSAPTATDGITTAADPLATLSAGLPTTPVDAHLTQLSTNGGDAATPLDGHVTPALANEAWISAVAARHQTDLVASGSKDGFVRLWGVSKDFKHLKRLAAIPLAGCVNGLQFSPSGRLLVAAVGQEPRLGRWWRLAHARNAVALIPLSYAAP